MVVKPGIPMGPKTRHLIDILDQIIAMLEADGEVHWRMSMESSKSSLMNGDYSGIERLLGAYGGMGSFNDLVIGQAILDGQHGWKDGAHEANDKLDALRSEAFDVATDIKHHHEPGKA